MTYQEKLDRLKPIIAKFNGFGGGSLFVDIGQESDNLARISYFPPALGAADSVRYALSLCGGKMSKGDDGTMQGVTEDGITIALFSVLKCEVVGFEEVKVPVVKETGEYRVEQKPIRRCVSVLDGAEDPQVPEAEQATTEVPF